MYQNKNGKYLTTIEGYQYYQNYIFINSAMKPSYLIDSLVVTLFYIRDDNMASCSSGVLSC